MLEPQLGSHPWQMNRSVLILSLMMAWTFVVSNSYFKWQKDKPKKTQRLVQILTFKCPIQVRLFYCWWWPDSNDLQCDDLPELVRLVHVSRRVLHSDLSNHPYPMGSVLASGRNWRCNSGRQRLRISRTAKGIPLRCQKVTDSWRNEGVHLDQYYQTIFAVIDLQ